MKSISIKCILLDQRLEEKLKKIKDVAFRVLRDQWSSVKIKKKPIYQSSRVLLKQLMLESFLSRCGVFCVSPGPAAFSPGQKNLLVWGSRPNLAALHEVLADGSNHERDEVMKAGELSGEQGVAIFWLWWHRSEVILGCPGHAHREDCDA